MITVKGYNAILIGTIRVNSVTALVIDRLRLAQNTPIATINHFKNFKLNFGHPFFCIYHKIYDYNNFILSVYFLNTFYNIVT